MSRLDDALREALRREEPPEGFERRLMAKVELRRTKLDSSARIGGWFRMPRLRLAMALAALTLAVCAGQYWRWRGERERGELAKRQYMLALRIAGSKLHKAQAVVMRASLDAEN